MVFLGNKVSHQETASKHAERAAADDGDKDEKAAAEDNRQKMLTADSLNMIIASSDTLMRQAPATADVYLGQAIEMIDARLGKGYAKAHPELVGAFVQAAAADMSGALIARNDRGQGCGHNVSISTVATGPPADSRRAPARPQ